MCEYTRCFLNHIVFSDGQEIDAFFFSSVEIMVEMFPPPPLAFSFFSPQDLARECLLSATEHMPVMRYLVFHDSVGRQWKTSLLGTTASSAVLSFFTLNKTARKIWGYFSKMLGWKLFN